jgi:hydrogenase maturation protein HypF
MVQGIGFRPFVHRLARGLAGSVRNGPAGVQIEIEGPAADVDAFVREVARGPTGEPPELEVEELAPAGLQGFRIVESDPAAPSRPTLMPDRAPCAECLADVRAGRRAGYPFTSCARCGPRFSIAEGSPWDRARTSMRAFALCAACAAEYGDPGDRRFHAETIACAACGPRLDGDLDETIRALHQGAIVALMGVGGFQLLCDATRDEAVRTLRARKHRDAKPFAALFASIDALRAYAQPTEEEARLLQSPAAPIVLVRGHLSPLVCGASPWIGAMLPASPLHALFAERFGRPLVCTSGNLSGEPLAVSLAEAKERLGGVADRFLAHDRPIVRPLDDSIARVGPAGVEILRRARGYAPRPIPRRERGPVVLAVGAHLKAAPALLAPDLALLGAHVGDLDGPDARERLEATVEDLLYVRPDLVACDLHPDYASTLLAERLAQRFGVPLVRVQHHVAHVAAVIAEHGIEGPVLGFAWDGIGLGEDGRWWGGEAFVLDGPRATRVAHLRPFSLPGGIQAIREPRRAALGLRVAAGEETWPVEAPETTSVGRLFDAVAALAGVRQIASFEAQAAMELEALALDAGPVDGYPMPVHDGVIDWGPMLAALDRDPRLVAARFHEGLAGAAETIASTVGQHTVVLSGGCFQNTILARRVRERLERRGHRVYSPAEVPPGDGGLSLGQALIAARRGHVSGHPG